MSRLHRAIGKKRPGNEPAKVEYRIRDAVGVEPGQSAEDDGVDRHLGQGFQQEPQRPQPALAIERPQIAPGDPTRHDSSPVEGAQIRPLPGPLGLDDHPDPFFFV